MAVRRFGVQGRQCLQINYLAGFAVEYVAPLAQNARMSSPEAAIPQFWPAAVIMERTALDNRWVSEQWQVKGVVPDLEPGAAPKIIVDTPGRRQVLHGGFRIALQRDEAEGYYMNITSPQPKVFVLWRQDEDSEGATPQQLTVSYHEGSRWLDSGETVDGVPLPAELLPWMAQYCEAHYRPEPLKKKKYASNKDKGRMGNWRPD
jgi:hypothetical protein